MATWPEDITPEAIRERAYELWDRNHRPNELEVQFWLLAEHELRIERKARNEVNASYRADDGSHSQ